jgi:hypothetical protein
MLLVLLRVFRRPGARVARLKSFVVSLYFQWSPIAAGELPLGAARDKSVETQTSCGRNISRALESQSVLRWQRAEGGPHDPANLPRFG